MSICKGLWDYVCSLLSSRHYLVTHISDSIKYDVEMPILHVVTDASICTDVIVLSLL